MHGSRARQRPYEQMHKVAGILAAESYRTWRAMEFQDSVELAATEEELELGVRLPDAGDVAEARRILAAAPKGEQ